MEKKERGLKRTVIGLYLAYYLVLIYAFCCEVLDLRC